ncbi:MAG: M20 family metallo-hydrolase, partial [Gaiellales bacterium]
MPPASTLTRAERTVQRLHKLAQIGRRSDLGGITRAGLSECEQQACRQVAGWMEQDGLSVSWDSAGNLYGRCTGVRDGAGEVWSGSHLDTVPNGGAFDGALGVLVGLEAVSQLAAERLSSPLSVVVFRDEEGWRFGGGCFGSRSVAGTLDPAYLTSADAEGITVEAALATLGYGRPQPARLPSAFVEVHIEQGPVLERWGIPHAAVTAITGISSSLITFEGAAGHAGTVPLADRQDAFLAAAEFGLRLREAALRHPGAVATVGDVRISEPAANTVPGLVQVSADVRAPTAGAFSTLTESTAQLASAAAKRHRCQVVVENNWWSPPIDLSDGVRDVIHKAAGAAEIPLIDLPSGAGHDAGVLAEAGVDSGMIFVRSLNGGASHRPDELTSREDVASAIDVLTGTLRSL